MPSGWSEQCWRSGVAGLLQASVLSRKAATELLTQYIAPVPHSKARPMLLPARAPTLTLTLTLTLTRT